MRADDILARLTKPPAALAWAVAVLLIVVWGTLRLIVFDAFIFPLTHALPLLVCIWTRRRAILWSMAAIFAVMHVTQQALIPPADALTPQQATWSLVATLVNIAVVASAVELILRFRTSLGDALRLVSQRSEEIETQAAKIREQAEELKAQNDELSQQAEELFQHAEELDRQSEELTAQNEELREQADQIQLLNTELGRREELLQALLEAARTLGDERAVADRLCAATLELIGEPSAVAVVRERRDDRLVTIGSGGVPSAGAVPASEPFDGTFADLVIRQRRTASLADASLRRDLRLLGPDGAREFTAVLSSPVRFPAEGAGVLEVYARVRHEWTEEQHRLVGWLALQTAQIVETLRLQDDLRRQAALIEMSPEATIVQDGEGRITFWSRGAEALYGWPRDQVLGRTAAEILHTRPDVAGVRQLVLEQGRTTCELSQTTRDGREVTVDSRWLLQRSGPGGSVEFLESNTDITERKKVEEALRRADQHKNRFLATLSHELRNPLAPIRFALRVLREAGPAGTSADGRGRQAIGVIERQLAHLVRLVDDLLDLTRIASDKIKLQRRPVTLDAVVQQAVEAALPSIEQAHHELTIAIPPEDVWLDADPERIAQVLINLLNNAARYTPDRGHLTLEATTDGGEVVLSVRDTGIGLRAEDLPSLFQMFSQVGDEGRGGGLGIGLALVKGIVELHAGRVDARSDGPGRGSEFIVRLPRSPAPSAGVRARPAELLLPTARRVLVVDDNTDAAEMMQAMLELDGHEVRVAHDGPSALAAAGELVPDIVLLDIGLPSMDGYQVARGLRADPRISRAHLVAVTGWGQEDDRARARQSGFDAHITKPADPDEVRRLVANAGSHQVTPQEPS